LIAELRGTPADVLGAWPNKLLSTQAYAAARTFGIENPAVIHFMSVQLLDRGLARLLATGSSWEVEFRPKRAVCYYKHDAAFAPRIVALLNDAWADVAAHDAHHKESNHFQIAQTWADCELAMGHPEQAMAALQSFLTRYPQAEYFDKVEQRIREILAAKSTS